MFEPIHIPAPLVPAHGDAHHFVSMDAIRRAAVRLRIIDEADVGRLVSPCGLTVDGDRRPNLFADFFDDAPSEYDTRWLRVGPAGPAVRTVVTSLGRIVLLDPKDPQTWDGDVGTTEAYQRADQACVEARQTWYLLATVAMAYENAAMTAVWDGEVWADITTVRKNQFCK